jgi:hypothetical protein
MSVKFFKNMVVRGYFPYNVPLVFRGVQHFLCTLPGVFAGQAANIIKPVSWT